MFFKKNKSNIEWLHYSKENNIDIRYCFQTLIVMQMQGINKLKIKIKTKIKWYWKPSYCDVIPIEIKDKTKINCIIISS